MNPELYTAAFLMKRLYPKSKPSGTFSVPASPSVRPYVRPMSIPAPTLVRTHLDALNLPIAALVFRVVVWFKGRPSTVFRATGASSDHVRCHVRALSPRVAADSAWIESVVVRPCGRFEAVLERNVAHVDPPRPQAAEAERLSVGQWIEYQTELSILHAQGKAMITGKQGRALLQPGVGLQRRPQGEWRTGGAL